MPYKPVNTSNPSPNVVNSLKLCVFSGCMATLTRATKDTIAHFSVWFFLNECNDDQWWRSREKWTMEQWLNLIFSEGNKNVV